VTEEKPAEVTEEKPAEVTEEKPAEVTEEKPAEVNEEKPAEVKQATTHEVNSSEQKARIGVTQSKMRKNHLMLDLDFMNGTQVDLNNLPEIDDTLISNGFFENYERNFESDFVNYKMIVKYFLLL